MKIMVLFCYQRLCDSTGPIDSRLFRLMARDANVLKLERLRIFSKVLKLCSAIKNVTKKLLWLSLPAKIPLISFS